MTWHMSKWYFRTPDRPTVTPDVFRAALLFDREYKPKPAYTAVLRAFKGAANANPALKRQRLRDESAAMAN